MATTLIAVVVALALGHLAPELAAGLRRFGWWRAWLRWLNAQFPEDSFWRGRYGIALALLPPLLAVGLLQWGLERVLWGLPGFVFAVAALFYGWGPRDLDIDVNEVLDAPDAVSRRHAAARLWPQGEEPQMDGGPLVEAVFRNALHRWFGPLFWFWVLGPFGVLAYRFVVIANEAAEEPLLPQDTARGTDLLQAALEWPVTQLMALGLALAGNFDSVMAAWRQDGRRHLLLRNHVLAASARASVRGELDQEIRDYAREGLPAETALAEVFGELPELRDAISLAWRLLVLWVSVIALFVVAGWVA